jgi:ubiquinone/menaquinone biosynthesis C-methylase UbiE
MEIKKFKLFESVALWNDFIDKVNKGIIPKDIVDIETTDRLIDLIPNSSKILDISIGDGVYSEYFIEKGFDVYGTDISDLAISTMKEKHPDNTWVIHDTLEKFPFPDNSFDLVFARLALHYFKKEDIERILLDINRITKKSGYLYILVKISNTHNIDTGKVSYDSDTWINMVSDKFKVIRYKFETKKAYSFEKEPSNLLHIISKKV